MKFWEALRDLENGKKIRKKDWPKSEWIDNTPSSNCYLDLSDSLAGQWEIYIDTSKHYSFLDVIKGMVEGKKYRRPSWRKDRKSICTFLERGVLIGKVKGEDLISNDWIEVSND